MMVGSGHSRCSSSCDFRLCDPLIRAWSNGCATRLEQHPTAPSSANDWFVTFLSGTTYSGNIRLIVGVTMQREREMDPLPNSHQVQMVIGLLNGREDVQNSVQVCGSSGMIRSDTFRCELYEYKSFLFVGQKY